MKRSYDFVRLIGCRVPAPSVGFCEGGWLGFARQFPGKGTNGDETRRSRIAASADADAAVVSCQLSVVCEFVAQATLRASDTRLTLAATYPKPTTRRQPT